MKFILFTQKTDGIIPKHLTRFNLIKIIPSLARPIIYKAMRVYCGMYFVMRRLITDCITMINLT